MPFANDEQRKAVMARLTADGGKINEGYVALNQPKNLLIGRRVEYTVGKTRIEGVYQGFYKRYGHGVFVLKGARRGDTLFIKNVNSPNFRIKSGR